MCVRVRVRAREYNMIGFFVQEVLYTKCRIHLAALVALVFCNDLPALAVFRTVVAFAVSYTLGLVRQ